MKYSAIIILIFLAIACTDKTSVPSGIIGKDKMGNVLLDMIVADRYSTQFLTKDSAKINVEEETFRLYSQVFSIHNISREDFVKSYKFYLSRPDLSKVLFDSVTARANRVKDASYQPKDVPGSDTLRR
ncbi:MAG: DUF4296 domain-containing protein [Chitinophagaceae bacterium]|nr:MAG: DUF4296 domain-containing protein [Chitinophagaceae bacterium]